MLNFRLTRTAVRKGYWSSLNTWEKGFDGLRRSYPRMESSGVRPLAFPGRWLPQRHAQPTSSSSVKKYYQVMSIIRTIQERSFLRLVGRSCLCQREYVALGPQRS